jgi:hypothetical protein
MGSWEIAQANFALPMVPLNEPELAWFIDALDLVNAKAEAAPGFRWRVKPRRWRPHIVRAFEDGGLIVNVSVWTSVQALEDFVYRDPDHIAVLHRRARGSRGLATRIRCCGG